MATPSKTRGNTKTTKKPAAKKTAAAKTTRAKSTTKKSATKKVTKPAVKATAKKATTKPAVKSAAKKVVSTAVSPLRSLHNFASLVSAALIVAAVAVMGKLTVPVTAGYLVRDDVTSALNGTTVFAPAVRNLFDWEIRYQLIAVLGVSLVFSLLLATRWQGKVTASVKNGFNALRWAEFAITSALIVELTLLLSGVTDVLVLKLLAGVTLLAGVLGYFAERQKAHNQDVVKTFGWLGFVAGLVPVVFIGLTALYTAVWGMTRSPWYVYALYTVVAFVTWMAIAGTRARVGRKGQWNDALFTERRWVMFGIVTKLAVALILIFGLQK